MKFALHKSAIPDTKIFVIKELAEKHFDPTWHSHSEYQLFYVGEGTGTRFIGDSIKLFNAGELVFTGPHLPHLWRSEEAYFERSSTLQTRGIVIYLNEHFLGEDILAKDEFIQLKKLFAKSIQGLEFYGDKKERVVQLMKELLHLQGVESIIQLLQILTQLAGCKDYHYISPVTYQNPLKKSETDRINLVYEYVLKNYRTKVTLEDVALLLPMTPTSFSRYFSAINNKPFSRFLSEIRIKHACKMLVETNLSISNICYDCGFNTLSNFNNQFKEIMSKTPLEYKKEFLNL
ncbi:AraC family transcriptional regulator [Segetibacter aerophilus]|uniref:AraC family transcriptional regulator n=1 Tax=Segetibacter aerophilus TaxID=670293 RepID=A0A512B864_9BACT|nr:AraC family transcriptional regulator [Segetibacter aerophilus]GEO08109.1 AraC family transcriptional regulator [Segetibacter aerophilus]